jgi:transposase
LEEGVKKKREHDREHAIRSYLQGEAITAIAQKLGYTRPWVYKWIERYHADQEHWHVDQSRAPHSHSRQLPEEVTEAVKLVRLHLYNQGLFCGAQAISWELEALQVAPLPSLRTINRIVQREGLRHRRTRRYEPKGKRHGKKLRSQWMKLLFKSTITSCDEFDLLVLLLQWPAGLLQQYTTKSPNLTVNDVMAHFGVNDVMALET